MPKGQYVRDTKLQAAKKIIKVLEARNQDLVAERLRYLHERNSYRKTLEYIDEWIDGDDFTCTLLQDFIRARLNEPPKYFFRKYGDKRDEVRMAQTSLESG